MANEFKHADIGTSLTKAEWEAVATHEADGETANDLLYFNGTSWVRATQATIAALMDSEIELANLKTKPHSALSDAPTSAHHTKYTDAEAVTAAKTVKLDDLTAPDDTTDLNFSTTKHGLVPKGTNLGHYLKDNGAWVTPAGAGDMLKSVYDPDANNVIALAQLDTTVCSETEADTKIAARMPSGIIVMWHGTIANIPTGYVICDGNSSTPNLLAKFVEGVATAATNPGATGGALNKTIPSTNLSVAQMPAHTHTFAMLESVGNSTTKASKASTTGGPSSPATSSTGSGNAHGHSSIEIRPLFYDIAFVMKT